MAPTSNAINHEPPATNQCARAALAGTPQVVIPQAYDQHYWAQRIEHLGIGTAHRSGMPTAESLTGALEHALQREVAALAATIGAQVLTDGARNAARRLTG